MIIFANLLLALGRIVHLLLIIYMWIIIIRALLSWIPLPPSANTLAVILYRLTEPVLKRVRRFVPPHKTGGIDLSPMIIIVLILFIDSFLVDSMILYARQILRQQSLSF
jgi:YggT family protein